MGLGWPTNHAGDLLRTLQLLEQHALLDAAATRQQLEIAVALRGVGHAADRGHDRRDQLLAPGQRARVVALGVRVDEVLDDGLRLARCRAPRVRIVAHHLVRVLAVGQPDDTDVRQAALVRAALDLADERGQLRGAERGRALAGGIDVVRQRDAWRVARHELDLGRRQRRAERADDVVEALLVGHQRVRVALDQHRHALLADAPTWRGRSDTACGSCRRAASPAS